VYIRTRIGSSSVGHFPALEAQHRHIFWRHCFKPLLQLPHGAAGSLHLRAAAAATTALTGRTRHGHRHGRAHL
jgi:hypothetical protein